MGFHFLSSILDANFEGRENNRYTDYITEDHHSHKCQYSTTH